MKPVEKIAMTIAKLPALVALAVATSFVAPALALAQEQPEAQPQTQQSMPSYASGEEQIHGRVAQVVGKYEISVHDDRGFVDTINLHDGTVINPRGLTLEPGQAVTILGYTRGKVFEANEIDTPYGYGYAYAPYYGAYPAPYYAPYFGVGFWGAGWFGPRYYGPGFFYGARFFYGPRFYGGYGRFYGGYGRFYGGARFYGRYR
jgi:hypothetical protein